MAAPEVPYPHPPHKSCARELTSSGNGPAIPLCLKMVPGKWAWGIILLLPRPGNGHKFEQALGAADGQGSLVCCSPCSPWGHKETDTTGWLNWTEAWQGQSEMALVIAVVTDSGQPAVFTQGALAWQNKSCHFSTWSLRPGAELMSLR